MKKTTININNEIFTIFCGINSVYGGFILETSGDPTCLNELEEAGCGDLVDLINSIMSDKNTMWEPCGEDDEQYIAEWLNIWGIDHD